MKATCIIAVTTLAFSQSALADAVYYCVTQSNFHLVLNESHKYKSVTFKIKVDEVSVKFNDNKGAYLPGAKFDIFERKSDMSRRAIGYDQSHQLAFPYPNLFHTFTSRYRASITHSVCDAF